ncbi:MAG: 2Fe-2S iron-sulfur cluster-binding protein [Microcystaceae cyanobacterium]
MVVHQVTLVNDSQNFQHSIEIPEDESILNEAWEHGIKIPFECVVGSCGMCQAKLVSGTVDQSEQIFLSETEVEQGYILACVAKPTSNCLVQIETDNSLS